MDYSERFLGINKRMDYLKSFYPFFKIYTSSSMQKVDYDVPYLCLDLLTLLIEKGRILGRSVSIDEIEMHINCTMKEMYPEQDYDYNSVVRNLLSFLETDTQGMLYQFHYKDPIRKKPIDHYIHLIEYDVKKKAYNITDEGLDFMISIKELPEESKISVTLILFKKQIESGSFRNALNTIRDLNLEVQRKKKKKQDLLDSLMFGDPDVIDNFERYTHEVLSQLEQENELFTQVRSTLRYLSENREDIVKNPVLLGNEEDFSIITEISTELEHGYALHNSLLKDYTDFPREYERICQIRISSLFEKRYQFQDALDNHIRDNLSNDVHIVEMHPMLRPTFQKQFSLFKIFEPQAIAGKKEDASETRSNEKYNGEKSIDEIIEKRQLANFKVFAQILLNAIDEEGSLNLADYLNQIYQMLGKDGTDNIDLIPFLIDLNSESENRLHKNTSGGVIIHNAYETIFNINDLSISEGSRDLIEEALIAAFRSANLTFCILHVIADPRVQMSIGGRKNVYISNMKFIGE